MTLPTLPITLTRARRPTRTTASPPSSEINARAPEPIDGSPGPEDQLPHPTDEVPREVHGEPRALHQPEAKLTTEHGGEYQEQDHTQPSTADLTHPVREASPPIHDTETALPGQSDLHDFAATEGTSEEHDATYEAEGVESISGSVDDRSEDLASEVAAVVAPPTAHEPVTNVPEHLEEASRDLSESTREPFTAHEEQPDQRDHDFTASHDVEPRSVSPTSPVVAEHATAHKPDGPRHAPGLSHTTAATSPTLGRDHDLSEPEDLSPMSSPDEEPLDEYEYLQGSEASGPAPPHPALDGVSTPSGYVSEDADVQGAVFNHPGEAYIEEAEVSGIDQLHPVIPDEEEKREVAGEEANLELDESLAHPSQVATPEDHEPSGTLAQEGEESQEAAEFEDELAMVSEVPNESASFEQQDKYGDIGSEVFPQHLDLAEHALHEASGFQETIPHKAEMTAPVSPPGEQTPSSPNNDLASSVLEDYGDEGREPHPTEEHPPEGTISPNHYREYASSPELPQEMQPGLPHEPQGHSSFHGGKVDLNHAEAENDYDSDNDESQRFVTPLPSHQSLRSFSQAQANLAREADPDDYMGDQYLSREAPRQIGRENQHDAGEDGHFDDPREDHADQPEGVAAQYSNASQEGTPVLRSAPEQAEASVAHQGIPDLNIEPPTSPEAFANRKSWVEEIGQYFDNEDESESRPETPPLGYQPDHLRQESSVTARLTSGDDNLSRPETPAANESLVSSAYVTPEALATRGTTNPSWGASDGWTPQSLRTTQSMMTSPPTSPPHAASASKPEPDLASSLPTSPSTFHDQPGQTDDPFTHEPETKRPLSLKTPWRHDTDPSQDPPEPKPDSNRQSEGHSGSLFKRMRSIFEQPRPNNPPTSTTGTSSNRVSYPGPSTRSPPKRVASFSTPSPVHSLRGGDAEVGSLRFPPRSPTGGSEN